jgi:hypothetical protein
MDLKLKRGLVNSLHFSKLKCKSGLFGFEDRKIPGRICFIFNGSISSKHDTVWKKQGQEERIRRSVASWSYQQWISQDSSPVIRLLMISGFRSL